MLETREGTGYARPDEDTDFTGDSGFSSSSKYNDDSDPYCVVDLWRRPPPNTLAPQKKGIYSETSEKLPSDYTLFLPHTILR